MFMIYSRLLNINKNIIYVNKIYLLIHIENLTKEKMMNWDGAERVQWG